MRGRKVTCLFCKKTFWTFNEKKLECGCVGPTARKVATKEPQLIRIPSGRNITLTLPPSPTVSMQTPQSAMDAIREALNKTLAADRRVTVNGDTFYDYMPQPKPVEVDGEPEWIV
jgi:hypothetical protein